MNASLEVLGLDNTCKTRRSWEYSRWLRTSRGNASRCKRARFTPALTRVRVYGVVELIEMALFYVVRVVPENFLLINICLRAFSKTAVCSTEAVDESFVCGLYNLYLASRRMYKLVYKFVCCRPPCFNKQPDGIVLSVSIRFVDGSG